MLKKMEKAVKSLRKAGRRENFAAFFVCLNIFLLSCIGGFFYLNMHGFFLKEKEFRIFGAVFPDTSDEYYHEILTQLETSIGAEGDFLLSRDCGYDFELQGSLMRELADRGAETIFVCPCRDSGLQDAIRECMARGVRIILVGRSCQGAEDAYAVITSDDRTAGETLAGYIDVELNSAKILLLGREGDASSRERIESFRSRIVGNAEESGDRKIETGGSRTPDDSDEGRQKSDENGFEIVRTVQVENGKKEMEKAWNEIRGELRQGGKFDLIAAADEKLAAGAYAALKEAGCEDRVWIVAVDGSPVGKRMLRASGYLATVMEYPSILASEAVKQAYNKQEQEPGKTICTQVKLVTKNIIYSYDIDKWE